MSLSIGYPQERDTEIHLWLEFDEDGKMVCLKASVRGREHHLLDIVECNSSNLTLLYPNEFPAELKRPHGH